MAQQETLAVQDQEANCPKCGGIDLEVIVQTFKDSTEHHRVDCVKCGAFVYYQTKSVHRDYKIATHLRRIRYLRKQLIEDKCLDAAFYLAKAEHKLKESYLGNVGTKEG